jgi:unsaturated rhamnogalacturonyl hydrolase
VTAGSETSGGVTNVFVENCSFNSSGLPYALRLKTCAQRGGYIQNVYMRNCIVERAQTGILIDMKYCSGGTNFPIVSNIDVRDTVFVNLSSQTLFVQGLDSSHTVTNVTIANCRVAKSVGTNTVINGTVNSFNNRGGGL